MIRHLVSVKDSVLATWLLKLQEDDVKHRGLGRELAFDCPALYGGEDDSVLRQIVAKTVQQIENKKQICDALEKDIQAMILELLAISNFHTMSLRGS